MNINHLGWTAVTLPKMIGVVSPRISWLKKHCNCPDMWDLDHDTGPDNEELTIFLISDPKLATLFALKFK